MTRNIQTVPYGYVPPIEKRKGTLVFYDSFEHTTDDELEAALQTTMKHSFTKLVLYPLHEETLRRMSPQDEVSALYKREKRLNLWTSGLDHSVVVMEGWESKRKKYTPIESALRHLTHMYPAPHFLYLTPEMANLFASFTSFEEWIVKIRLILSSEPVTLHPKLEKYNHRWKTIHSMDDAE
ncbi:hypothetical protein [Paenibacillus sp. IHBB 10380]|uniref:hypothetical protein n=1 Tax=Paenibacillus sp. IHBB 10380 TaxID=1566358 RepID=UPI0005CFBBF7|nr:hypothetical protein [Paenibacillus sp. IHBB 10380]AJS58833.1 hypothetical protein UB51_10495 [Paenibacillus sp. IHBB 10380]